MTAAHASRRTAMLLWLCIALFAARVIGQFETLLLEPFWLPDMDAWYSGILPYPLLLPAQIALLMLMTVVAWNPRVRSGAFAQARPNIAGALRGFACAYFVVMAARLAVNLNANGAEFWREGAIPVAFHWVLALFVLVSGRRPPAEQRDQDDEADQVAHGDVPALAQPLACGPGFGKQV
jgi:hypothetical protein